MANALIDFSNNLADAVERAGLDQHTFDQQFEGGHIMRGSNLSLEQGAEGEGLQEMIYQGQWTLKFFAQSQRLHLHDGNLMYITLGCKYEMQK